MKKHLFGLAIFISIVTVAVFVYGYFNTPPIPVIPAVDYPKEELTGIPTTCCEELADMKYRVSAAELDIKDRVIRARVDLEWNGKQTPPVPVFMNFYLMTANGERTASVSKTIHLTNMFVDGNRAAITVSLDNVDVSFARQENLYTFIEFSTDGKFPSRPNERIALAKLTSVLLLHDGQAVREESFRMNK